MRITPSDIRMLFASTMGAARRAGLDTTDVVLIGGSSTYGRPFRIVRRHPITGGHYSWGYVQSLGTTRREAYAALSAMRAAFHGATDPTTAAPSSDYVDALAQR